MKTRSPRNKVTIQDNSDLRKYRTELPNLIDDLDLSPSAYRLYGHYKRRAGAAGGECTEGLRGIAKHCKMSINTVRKGRDELLERKLIETRQVLDVKGNHEHISMVNIWPENFRRYAQEGVSEIDTGGVSDYSGGVSPVNTPGVSRGDTEEGTIRKEVTKKKSAHALLMEYHQSHLRGSMSNPAAQGKAAKELLAEYSMDEIKECYERLKKSWRDDVTLLTVRKMISQRPKANQNGNGRKTLEWQGQVYAVGDIISDDSERFTVMGDDGTPSKRWHTPEAFALDMGLDVEKVRIGWGN